MWTLSPCDARFETTLRQGPCRTQSSISSNGCLGTASTWRPSSRQCCATCAWCTERSSAAPPSCSPSTFRSFWAPRADRRRRPSWAAREHRYRPQKRSTVLAPSQRRKGVGSALWNRRHGWERVPQARSGPRQRFQGPNSSVAHCAILSGRITFDPWPIFRERHASPRDGVSRKVRTQRAHENGPGKWRGHRRDVGKVSVLRIIRSSISFSGCIAAENSYSTPSDHS